MRHFVKREDGCTYIDCSQLVSVEEVTLEGTAATVVLKFCAEAVDAIESWARLPDGLTLCCMDGDSHRRYLFDYDMTSLFALWQIVNEKWEIMRKESESKGADKSKPSVLETADGIRVDLAACHGMDVRYGPNDEWRVHLDFKRHDGPPRFHYLPFGDGAIGDSDCCDMSIRGSCDAIKGIAGAISKHWAAKREREAADKESKDDTITIETGIGPIAVAVKSVTGIIPRMSGLGIGYVEYEFGNKGSDKLPYGSVTIKVDYDNDHAVANLSAAIRKHWASTGKCPKARTVGLSVDEFTNVVVTEVIADELPEIRYSEDVMHPNVTRPTATVRISLTKERFNDLATMMSSQTNVQP